MARQTIQRPLGETAFEFLVSSIKSCVEGSTQYNTDFDCSFGELMPCVGSGELIPCVGNGLLMAITSAIMMVSLGTYRKIETPWRDYGRLGKSGMFQKGVNSLKHTEMMT
jgi:hypothetical protein